MENKIKNIIIYVMDCLRPDFLGCYGFDKDTSPCIDKIAKDGVIFKNAYTVSPWTKPAAAALVTGVHPSCLGMQTTAPGFKGYQNLLQKIIKQQGFKTYVFTGHCWFSKEFGFTEGFDVEYNVDFLEKLQLENPGNEEVLNKINRKIHPIVCSEHMHRLFYEKTDFSDNNFAVFWSLDAHGPYFVRGKKSYFGNLLSDYLEDMPFLLKEYVLATRIQKGLRLILFNLFRYQNKRRIEKMKSLYCETIRYNDERIGELVEYLKKKGVWEDTLFILLGDHGESFGEHGEYGHSSIPYNELIKIPLIVKFPGQKYAGRVIDENISICDIYPTVLDLLSISFDKQKIDGQSLINYLNRDSSKARERRIFIECLYRPDFYLGALIKNNQKYLRLELKGNWLRKIARKISYFPCWFEEKQFDIKKDPKEEKGEVEISPQLRDEFDAMRMKCEVRARDYENYKKQVENKGVIERLRRLGYIQ